MSKRSLSFAVVVSYQAARNLDIERPFFALIPRKWDDYGNSTLHHLYFFPLGSMDETFIGEVKIMKSGTDGAHLPKGVFSKLEPGHLSLGQDLAYYSDFRKKAPDVAERALEALNDVALRQTLAHEFEHEHIFKNSLLRTNEARTAFHFGRAAFFGKTIPSRFSFSYIYNRHGAETAPLIARFRFARDKVLPWRICAIIGKNGVGKTQLLSRLAIDLVQETELGEGVDRQENVFSPNMPIFSRVVALSFSAFDQFVRPKENEYVSYFYCGVTDKNGRVSMRALKERFRENLAKLTRVGRLVDFAGYLLQILEGEYAVPNRMTEEDAQVVVDGFDLDRISSGQGLAAFSVAAILAHVKENALILFDEPELHLHPNAIATLMRILHEIVEREKAFAILATHSPLVIREIPSKNVQRFERFGSVVGSAELESECLGEDISELTRQIFETVAISSPYKDILRGLAEEYTFEEALEVFEKGLSLHAMAFLAAQYRKEGEN